ncbi:MAG: rhamnogalacturonan acetylesterase [Chitinophagaceae bacterium]|nr:MAG: rhamnogalacturonan acetylesterase [Chitinophagaceae bacterium]
MKRILFLFFVLLMTTAFLPAKDKTTVYLIGDSTISIKDPKAYPETGWGMPFAHFFDSTVVVDNRAKNGRSTRTFIEEGLWKPVVEGLQNGDYVFIQFGHNDEVQTKKSATTGAQFTANLVRYVSETRAKGANPVLITPAARRKFNAEGKVEGTHDAYAALVREVAKSTGVPLIDLDVKSQQIIQSFGAEGSKMLFLHLQPGEHPNYHSGKVDDTHFSELGARKMAQIVLAEIKNLQLPLAAHIYQPPVKK